MIEHTLDELRVLVYDDPHALARAAADQAAAVLREAVAERGVANAMFATGNSQILFVRRLVDETPGVPWEDTIVFHMDEYVGVGPDHQASFRRWIHERIEAPAHPRKTYLLDGTEDPDVECAQYSALLRRHPLDLCCLGIGENGHLAFNDPPVADLHDPLDLKVVTLDRTCREQQVGEGHFARLEDVPPQAITVTVPALLRARRVLAIVPERRKADAVRKTLMGPIGSECPASALRDTPHAVLLVDRGSAALVPELTSS